ncbi:hypothetical protein SEA_BOBBY_98 [Mycobacterium phage Bobby]|nr:hypothetical protein SEA_BOBBY_98 [Mycobacterium phage Bobby]
MTTPAIIFLASVGIAPIVALLIGTAQARAERWAHDKDFWL